MAHISSHLPRIKYGSTAQVESFRYPVSNKSSFGHRRSNQRPPPWDTTTGREDQPQGNSWRKSAVPGAVTLILGAAVLGVVSSIRPEKQATTGIIDVAIPPAYNTQAGPATLPRSSPRAVSTTPAADHAHSAAEVPALAFEALNFYQARDGKPALDYPWLKDTKLIEPHRNTTLTVSSPRDGYEYIWEVRGGEVADRADPIATAKGSEAVVILTALDENMVTLKEADMSGEVVRQLDEVVMVKYVRREIRTLTDEEREELLDAMYELWATTVDGGNGRELYGDTYADIYAIQRLHFEAAMHSTCDNFHDGLGFLISHSMITNTFEFSLQLVNPKLTLPYWDWTIEEFEAEKSEVLTDGGGLVIDSPLFQESWFGGADPIDHQVKDGRWANPKIPVVRDDDPTNLVTDVYGRLRSNFNPNPSPYLTRGMGKMCDGTVTDVYSWPSCEVHHSLVTEHPDFYSWAWTALYMPHAPVHTWIGGVLNCEDTLDRVVDLVGIESASSLKLADFDIHKSMWTNGFFECEENTAEAGTSLEEVFSSGRCGCLGYDLSQGDDWKTIYYSKLGFDTALKNDLDDETKHLVVEAVCNSTIYDGDHLQAGSSFDPTFWPMHPTMERLFMFSVLTGRTANLTWPDSSSSPEFKSLSKYGDSCVGHRGSDVFPFGLSEPRGFEVKTGIHGNPQSGNILTNREILEALDARVNMLPYVYDNFDWSHCLELGVDFEDAW